MKIVELSSVNKNGDIKVYNAVIKATKTLLRKLRQPLLIIKDNIKLNSIHLEAYYPNSGLN